MTRRIDTQGETDNIRLTEQAGNVVAVDAGYWHLFCKEGGLYVEDDNEVALGPLGSAFEPGGRLTLTTATPVTTADVTGAATLYYTPYKHGMISLYDGARWIPVTFTEKSLSLVGYTASKLYDIWGYLSSGTLALESTVWTNDTTRATALAYQDGRLIKSGTATRLYLGTIYINGSGGQTDDRVLKRNVWNYYNRVSRRLYIEESTSHSYGTSTWRYWNNDTTQFYEFVQGVLEDSIISSFKANTTGSATGPTAALVAASLDWTAGSPANSDPTIYNHVTNVTVIGTSMTQIPSAVGRHYISLVEYASAANNVTFANIRASALVRA